MNKREADYLVEAIARKVRNQTCPLGLDSKDAKTVKVITSARKFAGMTIKNIWIGVVSAIGGGIVVLFLGL